VGASVNLRHKYAEMQADICDLAGKTISLSTPSSPTLAGPPAARGKCKLLHYAPILVWLSVPSAFSATHGLDGIWQSEGYGNVFVIQVSRIESFQFTTTTCVKGPAAYFIRASATAKDSDGDLFTIRDGDSPGHKLLHPVGSAGHIRLDRISALPIRASFMVAQKILSPFAYWEKSTVGLRV
jgi:hypothetical protein